VVSSFHRQLRESGLFPNVSSTAERPVRQNVDMEENITVMAQSSPRVSTRRISVRLHIPRMRVREILHTEGLYPYHMQQIQYLEPGDVGRRMEFCRWSETHLTCVVTFCLPTRHSLLAMESTLPPETQLWAYGNPHGTVGK